MADVVQIIPKYSHPHVFSVINDNSFYDEATSDFNTAAAELPFSTAVVTGADSGIDNTFVKLVNFSTKKEIFGTGNYKKYGQASLQCDFLFDTRSTNVWFMRVLPDNATYANAVIVAKYRKGDILDDNNQPTGLKRMEIKFETKFAAKPTLTQGANKDSVIDAFAQTFNNPNADPRTGYRSLPIAYVRSIGRGRYGNAYGIKVARDPDFESEYNLKMYAWSLVTNVGGRSRTSNIFTGSMYQTVRYNKSTLISDVLDQYTTGSCPIKIYPYEDEFASLFDFYQSIVAENAAYIAADENASDEDKADLETAQAITIEGFDPIFGYQLNTNTNALIPYYRNYTSVDGGYVQPDKTVANLASVPRNLGTWEDAYEGAGVLVLADENNAGFRWRYTVVGINPDNGNIVYDDGYEEAIDASEYDGVDLTASGGVPFIGGHDGDFQEITVNGVTREPTSAEMKLLLAREQSKAFKGKKDARILSPARIDLDFVFDANYNSTSSPESVFDDSIEALYAYSTALSAGDYIQLSVTSPNGFEGNMNDINVKKALYDLNIFRNKNGMVENPDPGAGCHVYFDCGLVGLDEKDLNTSLMTMFANMDYLDGRGCSLDLGYHQIYDPYTGKKIYVTATYDIGINLTGHMLRYGINKPYANTYATINAPALGSDGTQGTNSLISGTFQPNLDLIDWDVKEQLYKNRINYWITSNEGRTVTRACQNTRQRDASALLEENNVRVLNTLKKGLEKACHNMLYEWNDPTARKAYTETQMAAYAPWQGTMVESLDIRFEANEWEQQHMIMHCYVDVKFRDIIKRIILEININP